MTDTLVYLELTKVNKNLEQIIELLKELKDKK